MKKIVNGKEYDTETSEYLGNFVDYHKNWRGRESLYWTGVNVALLKEREKPDSLLF